MKFRVLLYIIYYNIQVILTYSYSTPILNIFNKFLKFVHVFFKYKTHCTYYFGYRCIFKYLEEYMYVCIERAAIR